ncbi:MAG: hypothetical protein DI606_12295 [Sphingobium sp.]|nr:MAG: hypothetical protein DI606_12295 [Sphingobium sp.]
MCSPSTGAGWPADPAMRGAHPARPDRRGGPAGDARDHGFPMLRPGLYAAGPDGAAFSDFRYEALDDWGPRAASPATGLIASPARSSNASSSNRARLAYC